MLLAPCPFCATDSQMLSIKEAAHSTGSCVRTIYDWINKNRIHVVELPSGRKLICKSSLFRPHFRTTTAPVEATTL